MSTILTFIIPVRHQENSKDWGALKANLTQTIASISAQTNPNWRAVIVANHGADLPDLPTGFEVVRVDFPPNQLLEQGDNDIEQFRDAFRIDKGRRVLMGMLHNTKTSFYMIVDDDDFVSNRIVEYVSEHINANGWKITNGYVWGDRGNLLLIHNDFSNYCGTSLIIRADLYNLPENFALASPDYIKSMLGSHVRISTLLAERGNALLDLPFLGAIYRIGHAGAHSKSPNLLNQYLLNSYFYFRPRKFLANLSKLRLVTSSIKTEFFGNNPQK